MSAEPSRITRRLLAALASCGSEETGLAGQEDWAGLAALFERELALINELALQRGSSPPSPADEDEVQRQVAALHGRYARLQARIAGMRTRQQEELSGLNAAARRLRAVRSAYHAAA